MQSVSNALIKGEKAYRYSSYVTNNKVRLLLEEYSILSKTPKGYWIAVYPYGEEKKFVLAGSKVGFAKLTKEEAFASFQARKRKQIKICKTILEQAEKALELTLDQTEVSLPLKSFAFFKE